MQESGEVPVTTALGPVAGGDGVTIRLPAATVAVLIATLDDFVLREPEPLRAPEAAVHASPAELQRVRAAALLSGAFALCAVLIVVGGLLGRIDGTLVSTTVGTLGAMAGAASWWNFRRTPDGAGAPRG